MYTDPYTDISEGKAETDKGKFGSIFESKQDVRRILLYH